MGKVKIGIGFGLWRFGMPAPETICDYAERAEDVGIDSIWLSDHVVSQQPALDVACVMALFAARTKRIKMGPSVLTLPSRNPIQVAKTYATLEYLSGDRGRVIMAVGLGSDAREAEAAGIDPAERGGRMREGVEVMRRLWAGPEVSYDGKYYKFSGVTIEPRPAKGKLDVWIGGRTAMALKRVARYGDGWFPSFVTPEEFADGMTQLAALGKEYGRQIDADEAGVVLLAFADRDRSRAEAAARRVFEKFPAPPEAMAARSAIGTPEDCVEKVQKYVDAGCTKFVLWPVGPPDALVPQIELYGKEILPRFA